MSDSQYYDAWVGDGRPFSLATPIKEIAGKIKAGRPDVDPVAIIGTIGDPDHLLAIPPQDHCPYSQTGWPLAHPYPKVTAIDIMHRPDLGVDCNLIFPHWLAAAKAGQLPWLKYVTWQAKRYDVRNGWSPVSASGHYDHMHASQRTDHITTSIGGWNPLPGLDDDMLTQPQDDALSISWEGAQAMQDGLEETPARHNPHWAVNTLKKIDANVAEVMARPSVAPAPVDVAALAEELKPHIAAIVRAELDRTRLGVGAGQ